MCACMWGRTEVVALLLEERVQVHCRSTVRLFFYTVAAVSYFLVL
jgi:hypothetical protein